MHNIVLVSKAEDFQRVLIPEHVADIEKFYKKATALYFPEVVLAYTLHYDFMTGTSGIDPLTEIRDKKEFKSNVDRISFRPLKVEPGAQRIVEITIDDKWLETNKPFSIIDGNHRINAYQDGKFERPYDPYIVPFNLLLFTDGDQSIKNKRLIFHNINSKARRLTTEEELKGIVCSDLFSDKELERDFGEEYLMVRKLSELIPDSQLEDILENLFSSFKGENDEVIKNSILIKLISFLNKNSLISNKKQLENVKKALKAVDGEFHNFNTLKTASNCALFIAAVGIELNSKVKLLAFVKWLSQNHLSELKEVRAQSLYDIYIKLNEQRPKVFVAMPYFSKDEIESYNETYQRVIRKINDENGDVNLQLYPIMVHEGGTKNIVLDMFNQINGCTIFIADITKATPNVAYELGYARSREIETIIIRRDNDTDKVPFDYDEDVRHPYNPLAHHTLAEIVYNNIKAILIKKGFAF